MPSISDRLGSSQYTSAETDFSSSGGTFWTGDNRIRLFLLRRSEVPRSRSLRTTDGSLGKRVEVAEDVDCPALGAVDVLERLDRILDVAIARAVGDHPHPLGDRPHLEAHLALDAQLAYGLLDPALLVGDDVEQRIAGADEVGDLVDTGALVVGVHRRSLSR